MSSSEEDGDEARRDTIDLDQVNPTTLKARTLLIGAVDLTTSFKDGSASFKLRDDTGTISIVLQGTWAEETIKEFNKIGRRVTLSGRGATVEAVRNNRGEYIMRDDKFKMYKIVYTRGIQGWWGSHGRAFSHPAHRVAPSQVYSTSGTDPHARPSSASLSKDQRSLAKLSQREPTRATESLDAQILAVPEANPENPYIGARRDTPPAEAGTGSLSGSHDDGASTQSDVSESDQDNEDGREPAKKKRKRVRPEIRKEWGLESTQTNVKYSPLEIVENSRNTAGLSFIAVAVVKREIYKSRNDFATELWLYDPTHKVNPARLCFFGQKEEHLPTVDNGDILILQAVNWQKDRQQLTVFSSLAKGKFLVLPALLASSYNNNDDTTAPSIEEFLSGLPMPVAHPRRAKVGRDELAYAKDVARWSKRFDVVGNHVEPMRGGMEKNDVAKTSARLARGGGMAKRELVEIRQIEPDKFYDVQGEIIKLYNREGRRNFEDNDVCQLFITDYTRNEQLMKYEDISNVRLPGQYALQVSVYGHQAKPLLQFQREEFLNGKFVHLRNVRAKLNENGLLEATMWIDATYKGKSDVSLLKAAGVSKGTWYRNFSRRRDLYCSSTLEAKLNDASLTLTAEDQARIVANYADPFSSPFDTLGLETQSMAVALNMPLEGSFVFEANAIGYSPPRFEDFVLAYCTRCQTRLAPGLTKCLDHEEVHHMYQFGILFEGEPDSASLSRPRILVEVTGPDAELLFPGLTPGKVFDNADNLARLRRRLEPILPNDVSNDAVKAEEEGSRTLPMTKIAVEGWKDETTGKIRWRFDRERTLFVDRAALG